MNSINLHQNSPKRAIESNNVGKLKKNKSQPQAFGQTKIKSLGETSTTVTSHPEDPQPHLLELPLLPQEIRQVVHRAQRLRMIRPEVRFTPCKRSAVQGLRLAFFGMALVVWGLQAWIRLGAPCGKGRKGNNDLVFGLMKKMSTTIVPRYMHS